MRKLLAFILLTWASAASSEIAGKFDYYVLSLSWSPNWCAIEGDTRGSDQCDERHDHGWILHGLWPQYENGYPAYCQTAKRAPSRRMTAQMADIMGTSGLAWHQWKKHGTCSNLEAREYYEMSRTAYNRINRPEILRRLNKQVRIAPRVIEEAFLKANPVLQPDQITITCKQGYIQEARVCLDKSLAPRSCGIDVRRDCALPVATFAPVR